MVDNCDEDIYSIMCFFFLYITIVADYIFLPLLYLSTMLYFVILLSTKFGPGFS